MNKPFLPVSISVAVLFLAIGIIFVEGTPQYIVIGSAIVMLLVAAVSALRKSRA